MTRILVGPTPLVALAAVGELDLLDAFDGRVLVPAAVRDEVTTEPARTNLERYAERRDVDADDPGESSAELAERILGAHASAADLRLVAGIVEATGEPGDGSGSDVGLVSDDRRLRRVADGFGVPVTGTFGVVSRAAATLPDFSAPAAKRVVRRIDGRGLHLTGRLRATAIGEG